MAARDRFDPEKGGEDLLAQLNQRAARLIAGHAAPAADDGVLGELDRLEASWSSRP